MIHANSSTFSASLSLREECGLDSQCQPLGKKGRQPRDPTGETDPGCAAGKPQRRTTIVSAVIL